MTLPGHGVMRRSSGLARRDAFGRWLALMAILLVAGGLRIYRAGYQEIWGDEAAKLEVVVQDVAHLYAPISEVHPRFYHTLLFIWHRWFGFNVFGLRMLPVLLGVLGVPLLYALARQLTHSWAASAVAAGWLALSPFHIYYSQDLTQYALLFVMVTLSFYTFVKAVASNTSRWSRWSLYVVTSALAVHTHYYAAFALVAQAIFAALFHRRQGRWWLTAQLAIGALVLPWFYLQYQVHANQLESLPPLLRWGQLVSVVSGIGRVFVGGHTCAAGCGLLSGGYWLLAGGVWLACWWAATRRPLGALLILGVLIPLGLAWVVSLRMTWFNERFAIAGLPLFLVTLGWGVTHLPGRRVIGLIALLPAVGLSAFSLRELYFNPVYLKSQYGAMLNTIAQHAQPGDVLLLNGPQQQMLFEIYHPAHLPFRFVSPDSVVSAERAAQDMPGLVAGYQRAWLVMFGPPAVYDPAQRAQAWLSQFGYQEYYQSFSGAGSSVTRFALTPPEALARLTPSAAFFSDGPQLKGYAFWPTQARPADAPVVYLALDWTTSAALDHDYSVFVHVWAANGEVVAQVDSEPASGTRPTSTWQPGEVIHDHYALRLPPDLPPGDYSLNVGVYDWRTGTRLRVPDSDHVQVGIIHVLP